MLGSFNPRSRDPRRHIRPIERGRQAQLFSYSSSMPMRPGEIKALLREQGWTAIDLAARWGHSAAWMSTLINEPDRRPAVYEDAFRGIPPRNSVTVKREARHHRKPKPQRWTVKQMFPLRRVFEAIDSILVDEGTRLVVVGVGADNLVEFQIDDSPNLVVPAAVASTHFADLGVDAEEGA